MEELRKALQETRKGKTPGLDGISPEILKLGGPKLKPAYFPYSIPAGKCKHSQRTLRMLSL